MWRRHRCSRDGVGSRVVADPGGEDVDSRSEDVDYGAVVGERGAGVVAVDGGYCEGVFGGGGAGEAGVHLDARLVYA